MKKFFKNNFYIFITIGFIFLFFLHPNPFKKCILDGCFLFFESVFPSLFPMFIMSDILLNYNFFYIVDFLFSKLFYKLFRMSNAATYIFILSIFSGTPTNAYITSSLVKNNYLKKEDAAVILSYSFFLNPLFLYHMLNTIFNKPSLSLKLIFINYSTNFLLAFMHRNYNYTNIKFIENNPVAFTQIISTSIKKTFNTFIMILGTIIFYYILCEGMNIILKKPLLNCLINGILETTGGLAKLSTLNVNIFIKKIIAAIFISFGGLSIHTQIKNIISDVSISYRPFFKARILHIIFIIILLIIFS